MRRIVLVLALCASVAAVTGCRNRDDMVAAQKAGAQAKQAEVSAALAVVQQAWLDEMVRTLPQDLKKYPKVPSPLVQWRRDSFNFEWRRQVEAAVVQARFLTVADRFEAIPKFYDVMEKFWAKKVPFRDYMEAYEELKKTVDDPLANLLADFDHTFVHVEAFYGAQDREGEDRALYFFRHWQVAFNFPRENNEAVGDYMIRLCAAKLGDYCTDIPFEDLHFALEKPYLVEVRKIVEKYLADHPDCPLNVIFTPFLADLDARLAAWQGYPEKIVVPSMRSRTGYTHQLLFTVSAQSIDYEQVDYIRFKDGWAASEAAWKEFAKKLAPEVERLGEENGPENMEHAVLLMDKSTPMSVAGRIVDALRPLVARYVHFAGRNRTYAVAKLTRMGSLQFREVPELPARIQVEGVGTAVCRSLGQANGDQEFANKIGPVVWMGRDGLKLGHLEGGKVVGVADTDAVAAVAALAGGESLLLVDDSVTYDAFVGFTDPLFIKCDNDACQYPRDTGAKVAVSVCGRN